MSPFALLTPPLRYSAALDTGMKMYKLLISENLICLIPVFLLRCLQRPQESDPTEAGVYRQL